MLRPGITIYFLRHGETDWNVVQRYQGQTDIPLNDRGRGQAAHNGERLAACLGEARRTIDCVASPLARASETMRIARRAMGLDPEGYRADARLQEQSYGHWEGHIWGELPQIDPEGFAAREKDKWNWQPRDGESYAMLSARIAGWLSGVETDCVVASHGAVSRVLRGLVVAMDVHELAELAVPQDKVMIVRAGTIDWL